MELQLECQKSQQNNTFFQLGPVFGIGKGISWQLNSDSDYFKKKGETCSVICVFMSECLFLTMDL